MFHPGDLVIYRMHKSSALPGPRAKSISPSRHGDDYTYFVEKYWVVEDVESERIKIRTRRGKSRWIDQDDPSLRAVRWWHRLLHGHRFPSREQDTANGEASG